MWHACIITKSSRSSVGWSGWNTELVWGDRGKQIASQAHTGHSEILEESWSRGLPCNWFGLHFFFYMQCHQVASKSYTFWKIMVCVIQQDWVISHEPTSLAKLLVIKGFISIRLLSIKATWNQSINVDAEKNGQEAARWSRKEKGLNKEKLWMWQNAEKLHIFDFHTHAILINQQQRLN